MEPSSICGNSCAECPAKARLGCPGCRLGPGHYTAKICEISQCAGSRNIRSCALCFQQEACATRAKREVLPQERSVQQCRVQTSSVRRHKTPEQEEVSSSLWLLFASMIVTLAGGSVVAFIMELSALKNLGKHEKLYNDTFWWNLAVLAATLVMAIPYVILRNRPNQGAVSDITVFILLFISMLAELCIKKHLFAAHKKLLDGIDGTLEDRFDSLWKWNIGLCIVLLAILLLLALGGGQACIIGLILWMIPLFIWTICYICATFKLARAISTSQQ